MFVNPLFFCHFPVTGTLVLLVYFYWKVLSGELKENLWSLSALWLCVVAQGIILFSPLLFKSQLTFLGGPTELILMCSWIVLFAQALSQTFARTKSLAFFTLVPVSLSQVLALLWGYNTWTLASTRQDFFLGHLVLSLSAWAAFSIAVILGMMFLILSRKLRLKQFDQTFRELPSLDKVENLTLFWLGLGIFLAFLSMIFGFLWWAKAHPTDLNQGRFLMAYIPYLGFLALFLAKITKRISGWTFVHTLNIVYILVLLTHFANLHG